jgi:putative Holliday junction resolvase
MTIFSNKSQLNQAIPATGRIMALDVGSKRIGIATCDETRTIANPRLVLSRQSNLKDFAKISDFIHENRIIAIIIGLPLNMDGTPSKMSEFVSDFAKNFDEFLEKKFPILFFDERLTSFEAREIEASQLSRKKEFYDDIAASLILEHFLSS